MVPGKGQLSIPQRWLPEGKRSELSVLFLVQVNVDQEGLPATTATLEQVEKAFRQAVNLGQNEQQRLIFRYATKKLPHPADCLVNTCAEHSFAYLLSESNKLKAKVLNSKVQEMVDEPWSWCGQVILIDGEESIKAEYLKPREVRVENGLLKPSEGTWKTLSEIGLKGPS